MVKRLIAVMLMAALIVAVASTGGVAEADEPDYTDPEAIAELIERYRSDDRVKLNENDKLSVPSDPKEGIEYRLESITINASTGGQTTTLEGIVNFQLPATDAHKDSKTYSEGGLALYSGTSYDIAIDAAQAGFAAYVVVRDETAPTSYEFDVDLPKGFKLSEDGSGGIEVLNDDGEVAGTIATPWAFDANGETVSTQFKSRGNVLVQTVEHSGAAYPVVADPSITLGSGVYIRWDLPENPDGLLRTVDRMNGAIVDLNCEAAVFVLPVTVAIASSYLKKYLGVPGVAVIAGSVVRAGTKYCESAEDAEDEAGDALDDIGERVPDTVDDPWEGNFPEDCTLMVRHRYSGLYVNKIQVEQCGSANGVYYND